MAKDYAKKARKQSSSGRAPARQENNNTLWWVVLVLIILFVGGLIYLKRHGATIAASSAVTESIKSHPAPTKQPPTAASTPKTPAAPRFDFYTVLPKSEVTADAKKPPSQPAYMLQLGVFSSYAAADELKAHAMLLGVETSISSFKKEENTLYRVWMGPYKTKAEVQQQQHKLRATQLKSVIVKQEQ